jgi:hypothetical protein
MGGRGVRPEDPALEVQHVEGLAELLPAGQAVRRDQRIQPKTKRASGASLRGHETARKRHRRQPEIALPRLAVRAVSSRTDHVGESRRMVLSTRSRRRGSIRRSIRQGRICRGKASRHADRRGEPDQRNVPLALSLSHPPYLGTFGAPAFSGSLPSIIHYPTSNDPGCAHAQPVGEIARKGHFGPGSAGDVEGMRPQKAFGRRSA